MVASLQADPAALPAANVRQPGAFPEQDFATYTNVPVFAEHTTETKDGRVIRFGRSELAAITDRCNRRITESGDYAAVVLGHTPSPEALAHGAPMPEFVGMAGPFRLGLHGAGSAKKYAILADFHLFKDCLDKVKRAPRRSAELWMEDSFDQMIIDPISLLGAEAPRLDLGLFYSRARNGQLIEKYSSAAPGPANAFVSAPVSSGKPLSKKYQAAGGGQPLSKAPNGGSSMNLGPEEIQAIVSAFDQLDWVQWVKGQMQSDQADNATASGIGDELGAPGAPSPAPPAPGQPPAITPAAPAAPAAAAPPAPPAAPPADTAGPPAAGDSGGIGDGPPADDEAPSGDEEPEKMGTSATAHTAANPKMNYQAGDGSGQGTELDAEPDVDDDSPEAYSRWRHWRKSKRTKKHYAAEGSVETTESGKPAAGEVTNSQLAPAAGSGTVDTMKFSRLEQEVQTLRSQLETEKSHRVNVQREAMLRDLACEFAFDVDDSIEKAKYGRMSGQQFKDHLDFIQHNCTPMGTMLFSEDRPKSVPGRPGNAANVEKYSKEHSDTARRICEQLAVKGRQPDYEHVLSEVRAGRTVSVD